MYDAAIGQFWCIKPYSSRRNFWLFVSNIFTCAKKICREDDKSITTSIQELNAFAIKYDAANKEAKDNKEEEQEKKERQINIKTNSNLRPSLPVFSSPSDTTRLDILSSVSEKRINLAKEDNIDNQIVTPPVAKGVVIDVEKEKNQDEKLKARPREWIQVSSKVSTTRN